MAFFDFREQRDMAYYHDVRVFICGEDVSPWITGQVSITYGGVGATNTASFTLSNYLQCLELTEANLKDNKWRKLNPYLPEGHASELAKFNIFTKKERLNSVENNGTHSVQVFGPQAEGPLGGSITGNTFATASSVTTRFPFTVGSLAFHRFDPVRVFVKNPLTRNNDEWYCAFTGYIDTKPFDQDYVSGASTIKVLCQDVRMLMQNMRTATNPSVLVGNENTLAFGRGKPLKNKADAGFFNDLISPSYVLNHVLTGLNFESSMKFLLLGIQPIRPVTGTQGETGGVAGVVNMQGVGRFKEGITFKYDPSSKTAVQDLTKWNDMIVFGTLLQDQPTLNGNTNFLTFAQMLKIGRNTFYGLDNHPDNQYVHFLFPKDGTPNSNLIQSQIEGNATGKTDWTSRLDLIVEVCRNIDYQFYVTGCGDIIFEFPMYDFLPLNFVKKYQNVYNFHRHVISDNINDEGGTPVSSLIIQSGYLDAERTGEAVQGNANIAGAALNIQLIRNIFSNVLASRVGVITQTIYKPGVTSQERLEQLGAIEFNKLQAEYNKFSFDATYRPYIGINRPIYHKIKERIGIVTTATYNWQIRGEVSLSLDLNYVRKRERDGTFRFITGDNAQPISYNYLYDTPLLTGTNTTSAPTNTNNQSSTANTEEGDN